MCKQAYLLAHLLIQQIHFMCLLLLVGVVFQLQTRQARH